MGDLNELVERLQKGHLSYVSHGNVIYKGPDAIHSEAAAALTGLIAERDGLQALVSSSEAERYRSCSELLERAVSAEAQLKAAREALTEIASLTQTDRLLWWQIAARSVLSKISEAR